MRYELFYWPSIQGRGEFVRLVFEAAGAEYIDVGRESDNGMGVTAMQQMLDDHASTHQPFAPPYLRVGDFMIGQTANILAYVGPRVALAPRAADERLWANQLQLTVMDCVTQVHDTHHPIGSSLYYQDQLAEAARASRVFLTERLPKFLNYFEAVLQANTTGNARTRGFMLGRRLTYVDLSIFQLVAGLGYAFPAAMNARASSIPGLLALHRRVAEHPPVADYLASPRRIPFNERGIFRHYPELDAV